MTQPFELKPDVVIAGRYRVLALLASGAMGAVYLADQLTTGKRRALKVMLPQLLDDERLRARFAQEAKISAEIASEHVVEVVDAGVDETGNIPWIAMELLDGETLGARLRREGALPLDVAREVMEQLGDAVAAAHDSGIVHRDLKPENVFLAAPRRAGIRFTLKVLDFGIAKLMSESQTHATSSLGTPLFMAPEQASPGARVTPAADVWALGLIAFRLLIGKHYWLSGNLGGSNAMMVLNEVAHLPMPSASARAIELGVEGGLPKGFDAWFARAVSRDPEARFPNAREARRALDAVLDPKSPESAVDPKGPLSPAPRGGSRRWLLAAGIVAALGSALGAGLVIRAKRRPISHDAAPSESAPGKLPADLVQVIIRSHFGAIRRCYEAGLAKNPKLGGTVVIHFVIAADGSVRVTATDESTIPDQEVVRCVTGVFKDVHFPAPEGGEVTITYPLSLSPGGD